jgi:hypothetical protein
LRTVGGGPPENGVGDQLTVGHRAQVVLRLDFKLELVREALLRDVDDFQALGLQQREEIVLLSSGGMSEALGAVLSHSLSTTAPTMSVGILSNPHATCHKAAPPWDPRLLPLVREGEIR